MIIEIIKAIVFGIVEGITEWLPISSTGHLMLVEEFLKLNVTMEFWKMFLVVIQLGAILAVVVLYFKKLNPFHIKKNKLVLSKDTMNIWYKIIVASIPAGVLGLLFKDKIDYLFENFWVVGITLIIYGLLFIVIEKKNKNQKPSIDTIKELTYKTALFIGLFQLLSLIPGTSRSGATILGAIILGTSRETASLFSFFLAIPAMLGASFIKLLDFGFNFTSIELIILLVGMVTAFLVSIFTIKTFMTYIRKRNFTGFGWYRIILGSIVLIYFLITVLV